jgi:orotate phosphoribosyltransferase
MPTLTQQDVLQALSDSGALLKGHFELRSGLHSADFFQCANLLRYPRVAQKLCEALAARVPKNLCDEVATVVAPALGGILVGHEIARALDKLSIFAEKADGKLVLRRFAINPGDTVLVAEDVVTRGGRVQETIDLVRAAGGRVVAAVTLVDRSGGTATFDVPHFSLLQMSPVTWTPTDCPLCRDGSKAVHPGS